jgi:hypothetical protein
MAVISRARKQGLVLTLNDILQSRSVKELAQTATAKAPATAQREEKSGEGFALSPVQRLYMESSASFKGSARFNQSMTVRVSRRVEGEVLRRAIRAVTSQHSMFRARFSTVNGTWQQKAAAVCFCSLPKKGTTDNILRRLTSPTASECTRLAIPAQWSLRLPRASPAWIP